MKRKITMLIMMSLLSVGVFCQTNLNTAKFFTERIIRDLDGIETSTDFYKIPPSYDVFSVIIITNNKVQEYSQEVEYVFYWYYMKEEGDAYSCMINCNDITIILTYYMVTNEIYIIYL